MKASIAGVAAVMALAWCTASALAALTQAVSLRPDGRIGLEAALTAVEPRLPPAGAVGYVDPAPDATASRSRLQFAQYVLAPRLLAPGAGADVVIVRGALAPGGGDPRLAGYELVSPPDGEYRVYRRAR